MTAWQPELLIFAGVLLSIPPLDLLKLLTSMSKTSRSNQTGIWLELEDETIFFCRRIALSGFGLSECERSVCDNKPQTMRIALPVGLTIGLLDIANRQDDTIFEEPHLDLILKEIFINTKRNQTIRRVSSIMRLTLASQGVDDVSIAYLTGESERSQAALYYATLKNDELEGHFRDAVEFFLGEAVTWPAPSNKHPVGSSINIKMDVLPLFFKAAQNELSRLKRTELQDQMFAHNRYVSLVTNSLCLMSGHRPVKAPFEILSDYDPVRQWLYLSDKDNKR